MRISRLSLSNHRPRSSSAAFSLIEMTVVIAILAVLATLAIPAINRALITTQRAQGASNMKSIGAGIHLYAAENNGRLPGTSGHGSTNTWIEELRAPLGNDYDQIRISPADPKGPERLAGGGTSYLMTARVNEMAYADPFGEIDPEEPIYNNMNKIDSPSRVILLFHGAANKGTAASEDHICGDITTWSGFRSETWPDAYGGEVGGDGEEGSANYLFADGHVQNIPARVVKQRIETGEDISILY